MKIEFFAEGDFNGKVPRNWPNMRVDMAWMSALKADRIPYFKTSEVQEQYDLGICIIPKKLDLNPHMDFDLIKTKCKKIASMQEGPHWYFQDYPLDQQIWFYNILQEMDFLYVHNKTDIQYYKGLTGKECKILPTVMIEDNIKNLPKVNRENIIIGGNFCSWYGGFDSYIVAQEAECPTYIPSMGRKIEGEEQMPNLNHLPYMEWVDWIKTLNKFKYGVHLMRTHAAGTFALNCAYLGIPCIGYEGLDTQTICHPNLTVKLGDLDTAKKLLTKLKTDSSFYDECALISKENYTKHYHEDQFNLYFNEK